MRAGELTAVWVPDEGHEAMRDLVRDCVESTEPLDGPLQEAGCVRQTNDGGLHRYRS